VRVRLRQILYLFRDAVAPDEPVTKRQLDAVVLSGGGHTIQDEGTNLAARTRLNFRGSGVTATDDPVAGTTHVDIPGLGAIDGGAAATAYVAGQNADGGGA
jgi:hypothetical protein